MFIHSLQSNFAECHVIASTSTHLSKIKLIVSHLADAFNPKWFTSEGHTGTTWVSVPCSRTHQHVDWKSWGLNQHVLPPEPQCVRRLYWKEGKGKKKTNTYAQHISELVGLLAAPNAHCYSCYMRHCIHYKSCDFFVECFRVFSVYWTVDSRQKKRGWETRIWRASKFPS